MLFVLSGTVFSLIPTSMLKAYPCFPFLFLLLPVAIFFFGKKLLYNFIIVSKLNSKGNTFRNKKVGILESVFRFFVVILVGFLKILRHTQSAILIIALCATFLAYILVVASCATYNYINVLSKSSCLFSRKQNTWCFFLSHMVNKGNL